MKILWPVWHTSLGIPNLRAVIIVFRGIASLKTTIYLSRIQTFQLKATVDLSVMHIFFKGIFPLFPWLFCCYPGFLFWRIVWISMITCIRHKYIQKLPTRSETNLENFSDQMFSSVTPVSNVWTVISCWLLVCLVFLKHGTDIDSRVAKLILNVRWPNWHHFGFKGKDSLF